MSSKAEILSKLTTASKDSLVHAINELVSSAKVSREDTEKLVNEVKEKFSSEIDGGTW